MRLHQESCVRVFFLWPGRSGKHQILFFSSASPWTGEACPLSPTEEHSKLLLTHGLATWTCAVLTEAVCCFKEAHWALLPSSSLARFLPFKWVTKRGAGDRNEEDRSWPQLRSFFLEYCRSLRILSAEAEGWRQRLCIANPPHSYQSGPQSCRLEVCIETEASKPASYQHCRSEVSGQVGFLIAHEHVTDHI